MNFHMRHPKFPQRQEEIIPNATNNTEEKGEGESGTLPKVT